MVVLERERGHGSRRKQGPCTCVQWGGPYKSPPPPPQGLGRSQGAGGASEAYADGGWAERGLQTHTGIHLGQSRGLSEVPRRVIDRRRGSGKHY